MRCACARGVRSLRLARFARAVTALAAVQKPRHDVIELQERILGRDHVRLRVSTDGSLLQKVGVKRETGFGASGKTLAKQLVAPWNKAKQQ